MSNLTLNLPIVPRRYVLIDEENELLGSDMELTSIEADNMNTQLRAQRSPWRCFLWATESEAAA